MSNSPGPVSSAESWGLRDAGLLVTDGSNGSNEVREFNGMWALKPDADPALVTTTLAADWFLPTTAKLALIRTARWFIVRSQDYDGWSLVFSTQFDGSLEKYFDDFTLNGKENLSAVWGQCVGCPTGPDDTARDIVEFIARGQFKTLACYDGFPGLSYNQVNRLSNWYDKTRAFQRTVSKPGVSLENAVSDFMNSLSEEVEIVPNGATVDPDPSVWQYTDIKEHVEGPAR